MQYVLVAQSKQLARKDAPPFIPDRMLLELLHGIRVFGPYESQQAASDALRTFPSNWGNLSVRPLVSLSEALDNPYGYLWHGDAPDE